MNHFNYRRPTLNEIIAAHGKLFPGQLKLRGRQYEGPCPACGGDDRFSVQVRDASIICRNCDPSGENRKAFKPILQALGLYGLPPEPAARVRPPTDIRMDGRTDAERSAAAERFWNSPHCGPIAGSPAEAWLLGRSLRAAPDVDLPALRFRPDARHLERKQNMPCMLAKVTDPRSGRIIGVHRTFFTIGPPVERKVLGRIAGGGIMLRGRIDDHTVIVTEGVEDGLAILQAGTRHTVWATGGNHMAKFQPPPAARFMVIAAHRDAAGDRAARDLAGSAKSANPRIQGKIIRPPENSGDWNDLLTAGQHELIRCRFNRR